MSSGSLVPVVTPVAVTAVVSTGLAVVVNLATGGGPWWLWVAVVGLTTAGIAASSWQYRQQMIAPATPPNSRSSVTASGTRSVAVSGNPAGSISTGDTRTPVSPVSPETVGQESRSPDVPSNAVMASGERSVAVGGNPGGEIVTGDRHG